MGKKRSADALSAEQKAKKQKFTDQELAVSVDEVVKHEAYLFGRWSPGTSLQQKNALSQKMSVNAVSNEGRDCKSIKKRWYDIRRRVREKYTQAKERSRGTGGGSPQEPNWTPVQDKVLSIIHPGSLEGIGGMDTNDTPCATATSASESPTERQPFTGHPITPSCGSTNASTPTIVGHGDAQPGPSYSAAGLHGSQEIMPVAQPTQHGASLVQDRGHNASVSGCSPVEPAPGVLYLHIVAEDGITMDSASQGDPMTNLSQYSHSPDLFDENVDDTQYTISALNETALPIMPPASPASHPAPSLSRGSAAASVLGEGIENVLAAAATAQSAAVAALATNFSEYAADNRAQHAVCAANSTIVAEAVTSLSDNVGSLCRSLQDIERSLGGIVRGLNQTLMRQDLLLSGVLECIQLLKCQGSQGEETVHASHAAPEDTATVVDDSCILTSSP